MGNWWVAVGAAEEAGLRGVEGLVLVGEMAGEILTNAKPPVDADIVYVHVAAEGEVHGQLRRREYVRAFHPIDVAGRRSTAIAWTTAGSVASVIELVRSGALAQRGFLKQECIPLDAFLATPTGQLFDR